ncbi:hypothetical protein B0H14DRAFT_2569633 [Mycena olivaceomarginata]|nr:hypothetical protein B0H14DRAFT_2569633 [Mycena olivaceomarginata]
MTLKTVLVGYADDLRTLLLVCGEGRKLKGPENKNNAAREKAREEHAEELQRVREMWPQVLPQSVKNQRIHMFREQTGSEALSTFTCAVCAESKLIAPHELYQKLTEGTLVLVMLSFATYVITGQTTEAGRPIPNKKVYHVLVDRLRILDHGDGEPWNPAVPAIPQSRFYSLVNSPQRRGRDDAADSAFNNFGANRLLRALPKERDAMPVLSRFY